MYTWKWIGSRISYFWEETNAVVFWTSPQQTYIYTYDGGLNKSAESQLMILLLILHLNFLRGIICDYSYDLTAHLVYMILNLIWTCFLFCISFFSRIVVLYLFFIVLFRFYFVLYFSCFVCFSHYFMLMFWFFFDLYVLICYFSFLFQYMMFFCFSVSLLSIRHLRDSLYQLVFSGRISESSISISPTWILLIVGFIEENFLHFPSNWYTYIYHKSPAMYHVNTPPQCHPPQENKTLLTINGLWTTMTPSESIDKAFFPQGGPQIVKHWGESLL